MYVVKFALLFIMVVILSKSVLTETVQNFSIFYNFSFEGGGGSKRKGN